MKLNLVIFIAGFVIALTAGFFIFQGETVSKEEPAEAAPESHAEEAAEENGHADENAESEENSENVVQLESRVLEQKGCVACHAVSEIGLEGPPTGPDLSHVYSIMEGKHGKTMEEFLAEPTSAVMATVLGENPLTEEEIEAIAEVLQIAENQ